MANEKNNNGTASSSSTSSPSSASNTSTLSKKSGLSFREKLFGGSAKKAGSSANLLENSNNETSETAPSSVLYERLKPKFEQDVEAKLQELEATNIHYKACQNGFKGFLKESTELSKTEQLMGQQMVSFSNKINEADVPSRHVRVLAEQFGDGLKSIANMRDELVSVVEII